MITNLIAAIAVASSGFAAPLQDHHKVVAIIPWNYRDGTQGAIDTANDTLNRFFSRAGYDRLSVDRLNTAWERPRDWSSDPMPPLPTDDQLKRIGRRLGVDLVCVGRVSWHTKSVWVALGPKTKSTCRVDMKLVDMDHGGVVLTEHDIEADDTAEESGFQTAAGVLTGGLITVVSGGPETPHQQRSVQIALSHAFEPWLEGVIGR